MKLKRLFISGRKENQLDNIFDVTGTPTYENWPACDWKFRFGSKQGQNLETLFEPIFLDLLKELIKFNPKERASARSALQHAYFQS